ncbi:MAG: hypothetical protein AAB074_05465 [Planctomycetota bacterium]
MLLDLILKLVSEAQERQRRAQQEQALAAGIPMAMTIPSEPKKKKKKKKKRRGSDVPVEGPARPRPAAPTVEEMLPTLTTVQEAERTGRDVQRLFVLGEILGPPLALRDDEPE